MTHAGRHPSQAPDIPEMLVALERHEVRCVVVGSGAAMLHGVDARPGDLDIVPEAAVDNLRRLAGLLGAIEGWPLGPFGSWTRLEHGEWRWIARPTSEQELAAWRPSADDIASFDHRFGTRLGDFDVVPEVAGAYCELMARARRLVHRGADVWVAHVDDLLARLTVPRRDKDAARVSALRLVQRRSGSGA